jgi:hypothetical protein
VAALTVQDDVLVYLNQGTATAPVWSEVNISLATVIDNPRSVLAVDVNNDNRMVKSSGARGLCTTSLPWGR